MKKQTITMQYLYQLRARKLSVFEAWGNACFSISHNPNHKGKYFLFND